MVQVRCPECGYLQTLSEERFVAISEDYLSCPHCHAKVPKEWRPAPGETVPEETRHKMLAFSRRILNGRNVAREVVYALESLVRHYGPMDETDKALGVGYAQLGDYRKAEGFLVRALGDFSDDEQILHSLMETLVELERFEDAVEVGQTIVRSLGSRARHDDVARLALALKGLDRIEEAKHVLDAFPELDSHNPVVKQARREINRTARRGLGALFGAKGPIRRLLEGASSVSVRRLGAREKQTRPKQEPDVPIPGTPVDSAETMAPPCEISAGEPERLARMPVLMEYWVYAKQTGIPKWEDIKHELADQFEDSDERERMFHFLESLVEKDDLAIEYILKQDAQELFDYPEDMIPHNAKDFTENDREILTEAEMIVRVRLSLNELPQADYLAFMVRFVESVRALTHGVVQDAVSHALWGTQNWTAGVVQGGKSILEAHVLLEILDEDGHVWMHTHGMQKFGLPDVEMEGIPTALVPACRKVMARAVESLRRTTEPEIDLGRPVKLARLPFEVVFTFRPQDQEYHFPAGSLRIVPHIPGEDPANQSTLEKAVALLGTQAPCKAPVNPQDHPPESACQTEEQAQEDHENALRERLLSAHEQARQSLALFKKSFQEKKASDTSAHLVKVGFPVQGGKYEWMWVSVGGWRGGALVGHLENDPVLRKDLRHGGVVQVAEEEIFDWFISQDGEIAQGAYTEGILPQSKSH
jgi:uncharacterized protein YegJ (DUF2314 family)